MKLGAIENLNRFDCCLVDDGNGGYQIKFIPKKNVPEAIGVPHTANEVTEQDETTESVDITFTRKETLYRDRRRGMDLTNAKNATKS